MNLTRFCLLNGHITSLSTCIPRIGLNLNLELSGLDGLVNERSYSNCFCLFRVKFSITCTLTNHLIKFAGNNLQENRAYI